MADQTRFDRRLIISRALALAGGIALPRAVAAQTPFDPSRSSMEAAEELSVLEATEHLPALYTFYELMHPDAQELVPRHVVIGWYQDNWHTMEPRPAVATGVRFVDWTWPVNGVTYTDVAEVSFTQQFDNADPIEDVVRLVFAEGEWRWFFGRDRAWVEEQIDYYNAQAYIPHRGTVPYDLHLMVDASPDVIQSLPVQVDGAQGEIVQDARQLPDHAAYMPTAIQYRDAEFPVGYAMATTLKRDRSTALTIDQLVWERVQAPPFRLVGWNLDPDNTVPFAHYEHLASEAVGNAQTIIWGEASDTTLCEISFVRGDALASLARALVALGRA